MQETTAISPQSPLLGIISGMEHSGTTALSQLVLANCPHVNAGFECGVLLCQQSPRDFHEHTPYYDWLCESPEIGHWGLTVEQRDTICQAVTWQEFYAGLHAASPIFDSQQSSLIDKTPAYVYDLEAILARIDDVPILVVNKPIQSLYQSYRKRGVTLPDFAARYRRYRRSLARVRGADRIHVLQHREVCEDPGSVLRRVVGILRIQPDQLVTTDLNWSLAPLKQNYSFEDELSAARAGLSFTERTMLAALEFGMRF